MIWMVVLERKVALNLSLQYVFYPLIKFNSWQPCLVSKYDYLPRIYSAPHWNPPLCFSKKFVLCTTKNTQFKLWAIYQLRRERPNNYECMLKIDRFDLTTIVERLISNVSLKGLVQGFCQSLFLDDQCCAEKITTWLFMRRYNEPLQMKRLLSMHTIILTQLGLYVYKKWCYSFKWVFPLNKEWLGFMSYHNHKHWRERACDYETKRNKAGVTWRLVWIKVQEILLLYCWWI